MDILFLFYINCKQSEQKYLHLHNAYITQHNINGWVDNNELRIRYNKIQEYCCGYFSAAKLSKYCGILPSSLRGSGGCCARICGHYTPHSTLGFTGSWKIYRDSPRPGLAWSPVTGLAWIRAGVGAGKNNPSVLTMTTASPAPLLQSHCSNIKVEICLILHETDTNLNVLQSAVINIRSGVAVFH